MPDTQIKDGCLIRPSFLSEYPSRPRTPLLLLSYNAPKEACDLAEALGSAVLRIPRWERLPTPVAGHPDMLAFPLPDADGSARLLLPEDYYYAYAEFWRASGISVALTRHPFGNVYPADVGLNQLIMKGSLFGRLDAAASEILAAYPESVNVRQGYARCSVVKLSENAAITADRSIAAALSAKEVEVLLIRAGHIRLDGYNCGFIGGASFPLPDGSVCFFGDLSTHPDCKAISDFAMQQGVRLRSLSGELTDFGGGLLIN